MKSSLYFLGSLLLGSLLMLGACTDKVDESNLYTSTKPTITQFLKNDTSFSKYVQILEQVRLSKRVNASSLASVLAARGNYTCFVPTNDVLQAYVDSITGETNYDIANLADTIAEVIAKNSIIDCGDESAYKRADFPSDGGTFSNTNLAGRLVSSLEDSVTGNYLINSKSTVVSFDNTVANGEIHVVSSVVSLSTNFMSTLIGVTPNMKIMGRLLEVTGWADSLTQYRDDAYDEVERPEKGRGISTEGSTVFPIPKERRFGYTAFIETDGVLQEKWGIPAPVLDASGEITNWSEIQTALLAKAEEVYGTSTNSDPTSADNALNQFMAYHFVKGTFSYNRFVRHYNEYEYKYGADAKNPQTQTLTVDKWAYLCTFGTPARLIKVTQIADGEHDIFLNRESVYDNSFFGNYRVKSVVNEGVKINATNGLYNNQALNGMIYPIDDVLVFDDKAKSALDERLRIDICYLFPEMFTTNYRGVGKYANFPIEYFDNIVSATSETDINYLDAAAKGGGYGWVDYDGDEFLFTGTFDFILKLPPVPLEGEYELRLGTSNNPQRGMAQIYFGSNLNNLVQIGLPFDMRQTPATSTNIPWVADGPDITLNVENDRNLRNKGYMKAPKYFTVDNRNANITARAFNSGGYASLRLVVTRQRMVPGETYYLRFKSALEQIDAQFFMDYIELVPRHIYASNEGEDIW